VIISSTEKYKTQVSRSSSKRAFSMKMIASDKRETTVGRFTYWQN
jgi:hypothetical protein